MSVLIPTMIGKHHLKLDMPGEFSNKVLQKCLTTTVLFTIYMTNADSKLIEFIYDKLLHYHETKKVEDHI